MKSVLIASVELRRYWRRIRRQKAWKLGLLAVVFTPLGAVLAGLAFVGGQVTATHVESREMSVLLTNGREIVSLLWILFVFVSYAYSLQESSQPDAPAFLLTAAATREVVTALLLTELFRLCIFIGVFVVLFLLGTVSTVPSVLFLCTLSLTAVLFLCASTSIGFALAFVTKALGRAFVPEKQRFGAFVVFFCLAVGIWIFGSPYRITKGLVSIVVQTPVSWYADLAVAGFVKGTLDAIRMLSVVALSVASVGIAVTVSTELAAFTWYTDQ